MRLRRRVHFLASATAAVVLAAAAFWASDAWFADDARQQAADEWAALQTCLLGSDLAPHERPSARLRGIDLAIAGKPAEEGTDHWLAPCRPHAEALDQALARPALRTTFAALPRAVPILRPDATSNQRAAALDALWQAIREADLPLPTLTPSAPPPKTSAPRPATPTLRRESLTSIGRATHRNPAWWGIRPDLGTGRELRLLLGGDDGPQLCRIADDRQGNLYAAASCRDLPRSLPMDADTVALGEGAAGGAVLLYVGGPHGADGVYDASSGQRIWRPRSAAQSFVREDGEALILYGIAKRGASDAPSGSPLELSSPMVDHVRLVRFRPGRAPSNRRLDEPEGARFLLLGDQVLDWHAKQGGDALQRRGLSSAGDELEPPRQLGTIFAGSKSVATCVTDRGTAVLFAAPAATDRSRRYSLIFAGAEGHPPPIRLGRGPRSATLACHGAAATVTAWSLPQMLHGWRCSPDGCDHTETSPWSGLAPSADEVVAASLDDRTLIAWRSSRSGLRVRVAAAGDLQDAEDVVLLAPAALEALAPTALHLFSHEKTAVLIIRSELGGTFALRIDKAGVATPLRPSADGTSSS